MKGRHFECAYRVKTNPFETKLAISCCRLKPEGPDDEAQRVPALTLHSPVCLDTTELLNL